MLGNLSRTIANFTHDKRDRFQWSNNLTGLSKREIRILERVWKSDHTLYAALSALEDHSIFHHTYEELKALRSEYMMDEDGKWDRQLMKANGMILSEREFDLVQRSFRNGVRSITLINRYFDQKINKKHV